MPEASRAAATSPTPSPSPSPAPKAPAPTASKPNLANVTTLAAAILNAHVAKVGLQNVSLRSLAEIANTASDLERLIRLGGQ